MFFFQSFNDDNWKDKWIISKMKNYTGEWKVKETNEPQSYPNEKMLFMNVEKLRYAISTRFDKPLVLNNETLVIQYELRVQDDIDCGGTYLKLFNKDFREEYLSNETKYVIMFGPDKCGSNNKTHFIFHYPNYKTKEVEEKQLSNPPYMISDSKNQLYTLIVRPDNSFEILIDGISKMNGSLCESFYPLVVPKKEIFDPEDVKPADWVDDPTIPDPSVKKPDDWDKEPEYIPDPEKLTPPKDWLLDEPKYIPDPSAVKPEDWDEEIYDKWEAPIILNPKCTKVGCGKYEPPLIPNPKYKGVWNPPRIPNPDYKGPWIPRKIPNPEYFEDNNPHNFEPMYGIGFELWTVNNEIGFNNILISKDEEAVRKWNQESFIPRLKIQDEKFKLKQQQEIETNQKEEEEKKRNDNENTNNNDMDKTKNEKEDISKTNDNNEKTQNSQNNKLTGSFIQFFVNHSNENAIFFVLLFLFGAICIGIGYSLALIKNGNNKIKNNQGKEIEKIELPESKKENVEEVDNQVSKDIKKKNNNMPINRSNAKKKH